MVPEKGQRFVGGVVVEDVRRVGLGAIEALVAHWGVINVESQQVLAREVEVDTAVVLLVGIVGGTHDL